MSADATFVVYKRPRVWFGLAVLSAVCFFVVGLVVVTFAQVSPAELLDYRVVLVLAAFAAAGAGFGYAAWREVTGKKVILSADELGVWVGIWGRRQTWDDVATIRWRNAIGDPLGLQKFIAFEPPLTNETPLGRWIEPSLRGRMVDLRAMRLDKCEVIAGLEKAAHAAGYMLVPEDALNPQVWDVRPKAS